MINHREINGKQEPLHALVIEDDMLILLDIEEILKSIGIAQVSCCTSVEQAAKMMETRRPHFALMDYHVGKTTTDEIALMLQKMQVPFAFVTASISPADMIPELSSSLVIMKPFSETDIQESVDLLLARVTVPTGEGKFA